LNRQQAATHQATKNISGAWSKRRNAGFHPLSFAVQKSLKRSSISPHKQKNGVLRNSGGSRPWGAVAGIALEEQRLAPRRPDHCGLERI